MKKKNPSQDINLMASHIVEKATQEPSQEDISRIMSHIGRKGGLVGGKARAASLTPEERKKIARKAAQTRWKNIK
jgi:hypothetical protein